MIAPIVRHILIGLLLIVLQVFIFENIYLQRFVHTYPYILAILFLPYLWPQWAVLIYSFILGLGIDFFKDTLGLHAGAAVFLALVRKILLDSLPTEMEMLGNAEPHLTAMGFRSFIIYITLGTFLHHLALYSLEAFDIAHYQHVLVVSVFSSLVSMAIIILVEFLFFFRRG